MEESSSTPRLQVPAPPLTVQTWENYLLPQTTIWKQSLWGLNGEKQIKCLPCAKSYKASTSSALWLLLTGLPHHTFQHPESPLAAWLTPTSFNTHNYISQQIGSWATACKTHHHWFPFPYPPTPIHHTPSLKFLQSQENLRPCSLPLIFFQCFQTIV